MLPPICRRRRPAAMRHDTRPPASARAGARPLVELAGQGHRTTTGNVPSAWHRCWPQAGWWAFPGGVRVPAAVGVPAGGGPVGWCAQPRLDGVEVGGQGRDLGLECRDPPCRVGRGWRCGRSARRARQQMRVPAAGTAALHRGGRPPLPSPRRGLRPRVGRLAGRLPILPAQRIEGARQVERVERRVAHAVSPFLAGRPRDLFASWGGASGSSGRP